MVYKDSSGKHQCFSPSVTLSYRNLLGVGKKALKEWRKIIITPGLNLCTSLIATFAWEKTLVSLITLAQFLWSNIIRLSWVIIHAYCKLACAGISSLLSCISLCCVTPVYYLANQLQSYLYSWCISRARQINCPTAIYFIRYTCLPPQQAFL